MPCDPLTETSEKLRTRNDAHDYLLCGPPLSLKVGPVLWHTHTHQHTQHGVNRPGEEWWFSVGSPWSEDSLIFRCCEARQVGGGWCGVM